VRVLGIEAYGLIGFFLSLQALFSIFDMGMSATLNRELARHLHSGAESDLQRDLVRTLEWLYWPIGLLIAAGVFAVSGVLAQDWLRPVTLGTDRAAHAIAVLGLTAGLQWPCGFYAGGFRGLERHVALNVLNAIFATLRHVGAAGVLLLVSPTLEAFVWWQALISGLQTVVLAYELWRALPAGTRTPMFRANLLWQLSDFALGVTGIAFLSFVLMQSDRLIMSTVLPLSEFGYYTLAATVAAALSTLVQPFFAALYPRYSGLVATGQNLRLVNLYHTSNQLLAPVVLSAASVVALFSFEVLQLLTGDPKVAAASGPILTILVCGTALNGLMHLPHALQLAHGWTRLALAQNLILVLVVVPATWWLGNRFGGLGAALVWLTLNLVFVVVSVPLMHRRLLRGELGRWYLRAVLPPALAAGIVAGVLRLALPTIPGGIAGIAVLLVVTAITMACAGLASPAARAQAVRALSVFAS
jgi:O-antigen/teichoic acid export membrane protein